MPFDLIAHVRLAGTAVKFVEGGPLAEALAELDLRSAISAFEKAVSARDKRSQIWSAINHLESALEAVESKLRGYRGSVQFLLRAWNYHLLARKRGYILALMAICYVYVGEDELARKAVEQGRTFPGREVPLPVRVASIVPALFNPADQFRLEAANKYYIDWDTFRLPQGGT